MHGTINIKLTAYSCICWLFHRIYYDARNHKHKGKKTLQYKPKGRRNVGRPRKRWRDQLHLEDQGTGNTPKPSRTWWWLWNVVIYTITQICYADENERH